jgi:hypothetical protein
MLTVGCMIAVWLGISGCGGGPEPPIGTWTEVKCIDDSPACITQRQSMLRSMLSDRERRWVKQPATADAYASGVRLFAFKSRKKELSCDELASGRREAEAGPAVLRGPAGKHLTPAQVSRGAILSAEVSRELSVEMQRRCKA